MHFGVTDETRTRISLTHIQGHKPILPQSHQSTLLKPNWRRVRDSNPWKTSRSPSDFKSGAISHTLPTLQILAMGAGFEPARSIILGRLTAYCHRPLGHPIIKHTNCVWCRWRDSNSRKMPYKNTANPNSATPAFLFR